MKAKAIFVLSVILMFMVLVPSAYAVSANDGFNPNANDDLHSIAVQADGKILVGGEFTTIGGAARNRIARLNADGTLDTAFNPDANNYVSSIAVQKSQRGQPLTRDIGLISCLYPLLLPLKRDILSGSYVNRRLCCLIQTQLIN